MHRGEYAIHGVSLRVSFTHKLDTIDFEQFTDDFIEYAIEAKGLSIGGGGHPATGWKGVIQPKVGDSIIREVDLEQVRAWLRDRPEIESFEFSGSCDLWYGKNPYDSDQKSEAQQ